MKNANNPDHFHYGSKEWEKAFSLREKEYAEIDKLNKAALILYRKTNIQVNRG